MSHKKEAERLRIGLAHGWVTIPACVAWADQVIASEVSPELAIVEVASAGAQDRSEVANHLSQVSGVSDPVEVMRRCLFDLRQWVGVDEERGRQAAAYLHEAICSGVLPQKQFGTDPYRLDDAFHLADSRAWGTRKEAMADLVEFLECHGRGV